MTTTLYQGDCLEVMRGLPDASIDAVITDPPYCSGARTNAGVTNRGGMQRGARWNAKPLDSDQMTTTGFTWLMREIGRESLRVLKDGGWFISFIDWRQYPTLYGAIETTNLRVNNMIVWDKRSFALGNGFRNQHELALVASKGIPVVYDRSTGNVLSVKRLGRSEIHPTEKPVDLIVPILKVSTPIGGIVLDPFMGSGTTGVACVQEGRNFIGIEREPEYFKVAQRRIDAAQPPLSMAAD